LYRASAPLTAPGLSGYFATVPRPLLNLEGLERIEIAAVFFNHPTTTEAQALRDAQRHSI
jgi:hypothetical protein